MHITAITITNLGGIELFRTPRLHRGVSIITGRNGSGKTSLLDSLRWIFNGGAMASLLKDGCDEGSAEFDLSNGYRCNKRLWRKQEGGFGYELKVFSPEGADLPGAKTLLDKWLPQSCFDADEFIAATPRERAKFLLRHVKLEFTGEELNVALTPPAPNPIIIPMTQRAVAYVAELERKKTLPAAPGRFDPAKVFKLEEFEAIYAQQYSRRTELNRIREQLDGTIATLSKGLGNAEEKDWVSERTRLEAEQAKISTAIATTQSGLRMASSRSISSKREEVGAFVSDLKVAISSYVGLAKTFSHHVASFGESDGSIPGDLVVNAASLMKDVDVFIAGVKRLTAAKSELSMFIVDETAYLNRVIAEQTASLEAERQGLSVDLGIAAARAEQQQQNQGVRNTISEQQEYLRAMEYTEADLTRSIRELEKLKTLKLRAINVPGFDIVYLKSEPRISIDGRDFDSLNFQTQLFMAFRFMMLANPELSFMLCESANAIDSDNIEALDRAAEKAQVQFVLEKCLADQPLKMIPADQFLEAEKAGEAVTLEHLDKL